MIFEKLRLGILYPYSIWFYVPYSFLAVTSGYWLWALYQTGLRQALVQRLNKAFATASLKNKLGELPKFIVDEKVDSYKRRLLVYSSSIPKAEFLAAKDHLESALQIYIDDITEKREEGKIIISYSHFPMPSLVKLSEIKKFPGFQFIVGCTRGNQIVKSFKEVPHLLVAGQTGGGKSTFLRQLITTLYLNNKLCDFTLVDLKGGLEFQIFEERKRISVMPSVGEAVTRFESLDIELKKRMELLKDNKSKDIDAYNRKTNQSLGRHIVVIDEAAEMFLVNQKSDSNDIQSARAIISRIARQGRAVGIHLVVATQRPDSRSLDPQVKANLVGVVCFQMLNDTSSISVLGNGRATDLPAVPGRAIWKEGMEMVEIQTPLLESTVAEELLGPIDDPKPVKKETDSNKNSEELAGSDMFKLPERKSDSKDQYKIEDNSNEADA